MEEEAKNNLEEEKTILQEYQRLKDSTVSKEKYEKDIAELKEKNKIYLDAIANGSSVGTEEVDKTSLEEKILELSKFKGTNLDYWTKVTSAIDKVLTQMPEQEILKVTGAEGLDELIKVNEGMRQMVNDSNGDPDLFRTLYKQRVQDSAPRVSAEIEKAGGVANYIANQSKK